MVTKINVGDLRRVIKESQNEFKPVVFGMDKSKEINDKAVVLQPLTTKVCMI